MNELLGQEDVDEDGYDKGEDCNDMDSTISPQDQDGDGYSSCDGDWQDQDASLNLDDIDGDGFTSLDGDCQDDNPLVVPIDVDGDGFSVIRTMTVMIPIYLSDLTVLIWLVTVSIKIATVVMLHFRWMELALPIAIWQIRIHIIAGVILGMVKCCRRVHTPMLVWVGITVVL